MLVVIAVVAMVIGGYLWLHRNDQQTQAEQLQQEAQQRQNDAISSAWHPYLVGAEYLMVVTLFLSVPGAIVVGGIVVLRRTRVTWPTADGRLPVRHLDDRHAFRAVERLLDAKVEEARKPQVPQSVSISQTNAGGGPRIEPPPPAPPPPPKFRELLEHGEFGTGALILGWNAGAGELVRDTLNGLLSVAVGGLSGSGKTWTAVSLILQSALNGAQIAIGDPHMGNPESLGTRLSALPASSLFGPMARSPQEVAELVGKVNDELERRKAAGEEACKSMVPILLVLDEWLALCRRSEVKKLLTTVMEAIAQEGRKVKVYGMLLAQRWAVTAAGGGQLRNTLSTFFVHRGRLEDARMLTGMGTDTFEGLDTMKLGKGECFAIVEAGSFRVNTPFMTDADVAEACRRLAEPRALEAPAEASMARLLARAEAPVAMPGIEWLQGRGWSIGPESRAAISQLARQGVAPVDIVRAVWNGGIDPKTGGRRYREAVAAVWEIVSAELRAPSITTPALGSDVDFAEATDDVDGEDVLPPAPLRLRLVPANRNQGDVA